MNRIIKNGIALSSLTLGLVGCQGIQSEEFQAQADPAPLCQSAMFDKSALVFDTFLLCGTKGVSKEKLTHAANVTAEWLDNDEDGYIDEPRLLATMQESKPVLLMSADGLSSSAISDVMNDLDGYQLQDLSAAETSPTGSRRDASQEEIHHLIMASGWQKRFPSIFSDAPEENSELYKIWMSAEENNFYFYGDPTCDANCKVTEFVYLASASYLGSTRDVEHDEMRLRTRQELKQKLPAIITLFESSNYVYPTNHWPDGQYPHSNNIQYTE